MTTTQIHQYHTNGNLCGVYTLVDGIKNGSFIEYYSDKRIYQVGIYENNEMVKTIRYFNGDVWLNLCYFPLTIIINLKNTNNSRLSSDCGDFGFMSEKYYF